MNIAGIVLGMAGAGTFLLFVNAASARAIIPASSDFWVAAAAEPVTPLDPLPLAPLEPPSVAPPNPPPITPPAPQPQKKEPVPPPPGAKESTRAPAKPAPAESRSAEEASARAADPKDPSGALIVKPPPAPDNSAKPR